VLTTTSPTNFPLIKSLGADAVFDYHDHSCGQQIRSYTQNSLYYIYDTISTPTTFKICADAFPETAPPNQGLNLLASLPLENWTRTDVKAQNILAYTTFGESFTKFGVDFPGYPEHFEFGVMFWKVASKLLREGKIIPHPVLLRGNGLYGIPKG
jgi:NADPH:quinone reductase-like Zn-dependent oxidoreductase